jgi:sugar lactone lactonase YvrE
MNKTIILTLIVITAILGFSAIDQQAHATSMTFTEDTIITEDMTIGSGETWTIDDGVTLTIDSEVTITIEDDGIINNPSGTIDNSGTININN